MARREVKYRACDRCPTSIRATETHRLAYNGIEYELDLCVKHTDALDREIFGWTRLGREVQVPRTFVPRAVIPAPVDLYGAPHDDVQTDVQTAATEPTAREDPIPDLGWSISPHAKQRIEERGPEFGFTERDVLLAAVRPEKVYSDIAGPGRERRLRNGLFVVVNTDTKNVITVMSESMPKNENKPRQEVQV
jgi:hypothetical protein